MTSGSSFLRSASVPVHALALRCSPQGTSRSVMPLVVSHGSPSLSDTVWCDAIERDDSLLSAARSKLVWLGMPPPPLRPGVPLTCALHTSDCTCTVIFVRSKLQKPADDRATRLEVYFAIPASYTVPRSVLLLAQHFTVCKSMANRVVVDGPSFRTVSLAPAEFSHPA